MTGAEALRAATPRLRGAGIPDAPRDARLLLAHALRLPPARLTLALPDPLPPEAELRFEAALCQRLARQPMAQITGARLFWGRSFAVTPDVLDPRPETETLIAAALAAPAVRILDLGTGSGVILLTLLAEWPEAEGLGVDLSEAALRVARQNARALGLEARATLRLSNWFAAAPGRFDLIAANPPYIALDEMPSLAPEVRDWEPHLALTPGADGLAAYRVIAAGARAHLAPGGRLMVECGPAQGAAVAGLFAAAGLAAITLLPDMDGRARVVSARAP